MSLDEAKVTFIEEANELLQEMEEALLALESDPSNRELLDGLFRAMHTIKGAAGVFGFDAIVEFTHPVETEVDKIRSGQRTLDHHLSSTLLKIKDHTQALVDAVSNGSSSDEDADLHNVGLQILDVLLEEAAEAPEPKASKKTSKSSGSEKKSNASDSFISSMIEHDVHETKTDEHSWLISLQFKEDTFHHGLDPVAFINYLKNLGEIIEVLVSPIDMPAFGDADFESCYLSFKILFDSKASKAEIESVFEFAQDCCDINIIPTQSKVEGFLAALDQLPADESVKLGEMLEAVGSVTPRELEKALNQQKESNQAVPKSQAAKLGDVLVQSRLVDKAVVDQALQKQKSVREEARFIRVDANKLGQLINLVGELVISSAGVRLLVEKNNIVDTADVVTGVEHLVDDIRNHALQLRMVQIGETFSRFRRVVRDVSKDLNKQIELEISGGESELDKTVVEKISDPLTHLIRNSLDHGIETPDVRLAAGKSAHGTLSLNAYHDSGHIVIEVKDDGAGLDVDRIRAKAEALGVIEPEQKLTKAETLRLIFEAGLSTKKEASNLSGRGVGMDVVRRNIESLRGTVDVDSDVGVGTTITIQLPLTLAIIDGFMVGSAGENYVIPLSMVEECVEMQSSQWNLEEDSHFMNLRGEVMPFLRLSEFFGNEKAASHKVRRESLVVVRFGRAKAGFVVDRLFGEQQTVIKPLGKLFQHLKGISGATVLGNGEIALILDVQGLLHVASHHKSRRKTAPQLTN